MSLGKSASRPIVAPTIIYPSALQVVDSLANIAQGVNGVTAVRSNVFGRVIINVPAGTTRLDVWLATNLETFVGYDFDAPVYIDGAYSTEILPAVIPGLQAFAVTLDGSAHTVEVWTAPQEFLTGTYVYAVSGIGISLGAGAVVTRRLACYGDSITNGLQAEPVGQLSWFARLRAVYPGAIAQEAFGGRQLWDDSGSGSGQIGFASAALLAQRLVGLLFGVTTREIWLAIGINDVAGGHWDAATFGANYAALLDAIHSADAGARVFAQSMLITTISEGSAPAYRTAISTAAAARPSFVTFVDGTAMMTTAGLFSDGLHPTATGHLAVFDGTGAAAGSVNMRGVLGV